MGKCNFCEATFINNKFCYKKIKTTEENIHKKLNIFQFIKYSAVYVCNYMDLIQMILSSCITRDTVSFSCPGTSGAP
jgi:hypothetical protein